MFYEYVKNITNNPNTSNVVVRFNTTPITDEFFTLFLEEWNQCDEENKLYSFFFDTEVFPSMPNIKYVFRMSTFIKQKKKDHEKYLTHSIIYVKSTFVFTLLRIIFSISSPIAPVYLVNRKDEDFLFNLTERINRQETIHKTEHIIRFLP